MRDLSKLEGVIAILDGLSPHEVYNHRTFGNAERTSACAVGWAAIKAPERYGLDLATDGDHAILLDRRSRLDIFEDRDGSGWVMLANRFDLTMEESRKIFGQGREACFFYLENALNNLSGPYVADKLRAFVNDAR